MKETRFFVRIGDESAMNLAKKIANSKNHQIIPLTADEMRALKDPVRFARIDTETVKNPPEPERKLEGLE